MSKKTSKQIVSANDLLAGDVVYLTVGHDWTRRIDEAAVAGDWAAGAALLAAAEAQQDRIVGPYLLDVVVDGDVPRPRHFREVFRERGPSTRPDLGRQADGVAHIFEGVN